MNVIKWLRTVHTKELTAYLKEFWDLLVQNLRGYGHDPLEWRWSFEGMVARRYTATSSTVSRCCPVFRCCAGLFVKVSKGKQFLTLSFHWGFPSPRYTRLALPLYLLALEHGISD